MSLMAYTINSVANHLQLFYIGHKNYDTEKEGLIDDKHAEQS